MKLLIVLISFIFILFSGCGGGEHSSTEDENESVALTEHPTDPTDPSDQPVSSLTDDPPIPSTAETVHNLCTRTCVTDAECGEKYNTCLKPHAGDPAKTYTDICTNRSSSKITLVVNEWDSPPGKNKLLCEFIENDRILYKFATVQKEACRKDMEVRKIELVQEGYHCGTPAPIAIPESASESVKPVTVDTNTVVPQGRLLSTIENPSTVVIEKNSIKEDNQEEEKSTVDSVDKFSVEKTEEVDICLRPCGNTVQCRAKHKNCLRNQAGDPVVTEEVVCTKTGEKNISFQLNEWNHSGQGKKLLCDLIENGELLRFATVQKNNCQLRLKERQAELSNEGYACQVQ